jgi:hypothetical protein
MLFAVLFGYSKQPNKLSPTLTQGGIRLECGDYRDGAYRPDSRYIDARLLPADFVDVFDDSPAVGGFDAAANSSSADGSWVELGAEGTAAHMESAFGATTTRDGYGHDGIVIEIDVVIDVENAAAEDPVNQLANPFADRSGRWVESPESSITGTALTKLNNRIDRSRRRERFKDRLRPI